MTSATDNRTTELLPCPFCGGEAKIIESEQSWNLNIEHEPTCFFAIEAWVEWTKAEAIAAWNTRAEGGGGECEGSKERLQKMLGEMKKLANDGRRDWCGRSHGEYGIFASLEDFAKLTEQQMDEPWMWGSRI